MWKFKLFSDPLEQLPVWLNQMAQKGYRLTAVKNCFYAFEKSDVRVSYSVRFVGYDDYMLTLALMNRLDSANLKTFRAPLNQMNFAFLRVRLRPLADKGAWIATSMDNYNHEILIVEAKGDVPHDLLPTDAEKVSAYKKIRDAYLQGVLVVLLAKAQRRYQATKKR